MNYAQNLYSIARELLIMCNDRASFDSKIFDIKMKNFASLYKRSSLETQSLYHEIWRENL
jgi:hypothetical protein